MNYAETANLVKVVAAAVKENKMKKIICYGDSNTFGYNTSDGSRYDEDTRWTCVLQKNFKEEYEVINEGMCDRTGFVDNPKGFLFSAQRHFPKMLSKTDNVDLLILWLGTNDLQSQYDIGFNAVESGLEKLIRLAKGKAKHIVIIPPVILSEKVVEGPFNFQFDETSIGKSKKIGRIFKKLSNINYCDFFDVNKFVSPTDIDGLHYDETAHKLIGEKLTNFVSNIVM